jgi:predicted permease
MRLRIAVTVLQIAVALTVTIGSALLLRTVHALYKVLPGFELAQVSTMRLQLPTARYGEAGAVELFARLLERVRQLPSVQSAGVAAKIPLRGWPALEQQFRAGGTDTARLLPVNFVDAGYFDALSIPLLAGRHLPPLGHAQGGEILLSRQAAEHLFDDPTGAASVGKRLSLAPTGPDYTVVGIVADVREFDLARPPEPLVYRPLALPIDPQSEPSTRRNMALMVKSNLPAEELEPTLRRIVHELDPAVAVFRVEAMDAVARASTARLQLILVLLTAAAVITLLLSSVGLYGLMAFTVAQRTREFGVRMALGAPPAGIARQVVRRGLLLAAAGIGFGLLLYALVAPLLVAFLFGVGQQDPATLAVASGLLLAIALVATWLPAQRAAQVDPAQSLRAE